MKSKSVFCAIPCFDEAYNLPSLFADLKKHRVADVCEIVFVDDHSSDETNKLIREAGYRVIRHEENSGYGQAVRTGFNVALEEGYESFALFPGDHQRQAKDLMRLIEMHQFKKFDVITGSKFHIYSDKYGPINRRIGNIIYSKIAKFGWKSPIEDVLSGFKIYRTKSVAPFFYHLPNGYPFDICFSLYASRFGLTIAEVPVDCRYDNHTSKMNSVLWISFKMLINVMLHYVLQPVICPAPELIRAEPNSVRLEGAASKTSRAS